MRVEHKDVKMQGGIVRNFYITDDIRADHEEFDYETYRWKKVESTTSQKYFVKNLQGLATGDRVNLYINSMGGSVKEALGIYSLLQRCPAQVVAYIDGFAASAASVIAMAAEKVVMPRNTAMMIHNAAWWEYGNPAQLRKSADDLEVINKAAIESYTMHAGDKLTEETLQQMLDAETWLTAEDCMKYGLADEFAEADVSEDDALTMFAAKAQAAMHTPSAWMFRAAPAFLADRYESPVAQTMKLPNNPNGKGTIPENNSCIAMLLKSMTE